MSNLVKDSFNIVDTQMTMIGIMITVVVWHTQL